MSAQGKASRRQPQSDALGRSMGFLRPVKGTTIHHGMDTGDYPPDCERAAGIHPAGRLDSLMIKSDRRRIRDWPNQSTVSNSRASLRR